ncbi:recombinase family protein [Mammaliicoccus sciuri]|uniref:recombinase family protein n=1 Tax=Mammaliicoccus sciuri TaxID=1296 RepID=UPI001E48B492|nr:recombinase family protein [Mammaliicoccus sciuri]MCD8777425.1 recombinase family protein [Mammaliicoccus sciuri]MCD8780811.1 recombinase family protein [Mammaliicoccus sciuri]MEB6057343.1 recombinase family protein [Mammaliicoccus sciuri]
MKVAIYCRVSTLEQFKGGHSIEEQQKKLISFCEINDWNNYEVFIDGGISGKDTERPALQNLLNNLNNIDLVLVYKLDRLTRSVRDLLSLLDTFEANNVSFRSATEVYDTSNAMGRLFVTLVGAMAEWERTTITERTMLGKTSAAEKGYYLNIPPFCFNKVDRQLVPNDKRKVIDYMVKLAKNNTSASVIASELNKRSIPSPTGKSWTRRSVIALLRNPTLRGHTFHGDIKKYNTHEAIISEDDFKMIDYNISDRTNTKVHKHNAVFRGKIVCKECGNHYNLDVQRRKRANGEISETKYYRCSECHKNKRHSPTVRADILEEDFINFIKYNKLIIDNYEMPKPTEEKQIDIDKVMKQREKYQKAWSMDLMTDDEFKKLMNETSDIIEEYNKQQNVNVQKEVDTNQIKTINNLVLKIWSKLNDKDKEKLIKENIKSIDCDIIEGSGYGVKRIPNRVRINQITYNI